MLRRLRETAAEVQGHHEFTNDIRAAIHAGDEAAKDTFRTGTLAAALTRKGRDARGSEVVKYVKDAVASGDTGRLGWLNRKGPS
ncbi:hypothetical protein OG875_04970 [Streptomyces sp. NBC_01498]|uniref:hypothetical protein n=1 Tax=Streptomyces sp. NBC_01498 TaxID=2975870 RepID=UPI002E7B993B|nr:hypothetical protein [Streptomyces sp. NBC_01498]WTL24009.1 hypothetical protein OG875_04970 [Streptomyces sp. NBC_01498]